MLSFMRASGLEPWGWGSQPLILILDTAGEHTSWPCNENTSFKARVCMSVCVQVFICVFFFLTPHSLSLAFIITHHPPWYFPAFPHAALSAKSSVFSPRIISLFIPICKAQLQHGPVLRSFPSSHGSLLSSLWSFSQPYTSVPPAANASLNFVP